ncbi:MAG: hypothetical protein RMI94_00490 [Bryobacterales bacterium]|nr:hypothetical protein [Bryobacteraceae bacterium]MDW8128997.1 hypothetical protein [Bryobacterales bacterium]
MRINRWLRLGSALAIATSAVAQPVQLKIYSEFQRVDPFGRIVRADRAPRPREILSPAVPRNGYASFHVAVTVPEGQPFRLFFGQNPDDVFRLTLYRARFVRVGEEWVPDELIRVLEPYDSLAHPATDPIPGQTTSVFWLDVWTPAQAPVRRVRLEAQLNVGDHWVIAPMEVRIRPARIPDHAPPTGTLPHVSEPADRAALRPWLRYLCGQAGSPATAPLSVRRMIRRNAAQDVALAQQLEPRLGSVAVRQRLFEMFGAPDEQAWCRDPAGPGGQGAEWYLRVRDYLLRAAE